MSDTEEEITGVRNFLDCLVDTNYFNQNHWKEIWENNRFVFIINSTIHDKLIEEKVLLMGCQSSMPLELAKYLSQISKKREKLQPFKNFDEFKQILNKIEINEVIPDNFRTVILESLKNNKSLYEKFEEIAIREYWSYYNTIQAGNVSLK